MPITKQMEELILTKPLTGIAQTHPEKERKLHAIEALPVEAKYRVAAYCRVSTDSEEQEGSLIVQREHFLTIIGMNPDWEFVDIYYEQGISGTKKETRPELNRLLQDCKTGIVNLVLTKSISRFARNTTDCLEMVRQLMRIGVNLVFEKEQIDTRLMESEFLMTILASLAEDESRSNSNNNKWAIQKRFQNNTYRPANAPFGYDLVDGKLLINEEEARIVQMAFDMYLSGIGTQRIAKKIISEAIPSKRTGQIWRGRKKASSWSAPQVLKILQNIDYTGDMVLQQTYHDESFNVRPNKGERPRYYITDHHPAIVSWDIFNRVQELMLQRRKEHGCGTQKQKHLLTQKVYCGNCGSVMYRVHGSRGYPNEYRWECKTHHKEISKCAMRTVLEGNIMNCWQTMLNKLGFSDEFLTCYRECQVQGWRKANLEEITLLEEKLKSIRDAKSAIEQAHSANMIDMKTLIQNRNRITTEERVLNADLMRLICPASEETKRFQKALHGGMPSEEILKGFVEKIVCIDRFTFQFHLSCGLILTEETDEKDYNNYGRW